MTIKKKRGSKIFSIRSGIFLVCLLSSSLALGQLKIRGLQRGNFAADRESSFTRTKETPPLTLPFFDDFSEPYIRTNRGEMYPDTALWSRGFSVSVNDGLGINPPTINVATFDGLDSTGNAYNATEIFLNGFTDVLVSKAIDLSETAPTNAVSVAERNSVYLSFYYQWKGNGEAPDPDDYLQVQFLNESKQWETALTINSSETLLKDKFHSTIIKVDGDRFFSKEFRIRFRTFGRQSGPYDTWNLDYVYLNKGRTVNDLGLPDQAISSPLTSIFPNQYRAIPYLHFLQNPVVTTPKFNVSNLRGDPPDVLNYYVSGKVDNFYYSEDDTTVTTKVINNLDPNPAPPNNEGINDDGGGTILPFESRTVNVKYINSLDTITYMDPKADAAEIQLQVNLLTGDNVNPLTGLPADDYNPKYSPIDFRVNDTLVTSFALKNYYAYDDGVAEYAGGLIEAGNVFAYRFDLPENLPDSLRVLEAFDIYFPEFSLNSSQNVDFFVFKEQGGKPNEVEVRIPAVSIRKQENKGFQRVRFLPALEIRQNSFFIGWRQPISGDVLVGLDMSNDTGSKMFFNTAGGISPDPAQWQQNTLIKGSFMVRPIFGYGEVDPTTGIEEDTKLSLYPNPNKGSFQISGKAENISILSLTGQPVNFEKVVHEDRTYVIVEVPAGLYVVRYTNMGVSHAEKILVTR